VKHTNSCLKRPESSLDGLDGGNAEASVARSVGYLRNGLGAEKAPFTLRDEGKPDSTVATGLFGDWVGSESGWQVETTMSNVNVVDSEDQN